MSDSRQIQIRRPRFFVRPFPSKVPFARCMAPHRPFMAPVARGFHHVSVFPPVPSSAAGSISLRPYSPDVRRSDTRPHSRTFYRTIHLSARTASVPAVPPYAPVRPPQSGFRPVRRRRYVSPPYRVISPSFSIARQITCRPFGVIFVCELVRIVSAPLYTISRTVNCPRFMWSAYGVSVPRASR